MTSELRGETGVTPASKAVIPASGTGFNENEIDESRRPVFEGNVLLCEDSAINQHVINGHLTRLGLNVTIANNGKEGVDIVIDRISGKEKPFDLILMDVHMPVMDGITAADIIIKLGSKAPIVAMTADNTERDKITYKAHGMPDSVSKPFTTKELWACLYRYFTPIRHEEVSKREAMNDEEKRRNKLFTNFAKKNQTTFRDINRALAEGDIKLAHRMVHTLRGLAGLMGKSALQSAARVVELSIAGGSAQNLKIGELKALGAELSLVLEELAPYLDERRPMAAKTLDKENAAVLFNKLQKLLEDDNASCLELADDLRKLPGTDELVSQMEEYEFEEALETLADLRKAVEV